MKRLVTAIFCFTFLLVLPAWGEALETMNPEQVRIGGYLGQRMDDCYKNWVNSLDPDYLVEPFRHRDATKDWKTEFWGKWMLGAVPLAEYNHDQQMKARIAKSVKSLIATQSGDGYIGNYTMEARANGPWDIWGRKYTMLGLMRYYDMSGDKSALNAARRVADNLMTQVGPGIKDIYRVGNFRGMASCSVLEPIVLLYNRTNDKRYLEFANYIVSQWEEKDAPDLVGKALKGVHVGERFEHPKSWWSFENGMKAYEMMSCYQGVTELYRVNGKRNYLRACRRTIDDIHATEINIAGSGSAFEGWYGGRAKQQVPAYHTMETCVTTTWIKYCQTMLGLTGDPKYADWLEVSVYNALLGALKTDGTEFAKYSPLEGRKFHSEGQCGMSLHCCSANGPRGFVAMPESIVMRGKDALYLNFYAPSTIKTIHPGTRQKLTLVQKTSYPESGKVEITVNAEATNLKRQFTLNLRIPGWSRRTSIKVNGKPVEGIEPGSYKGIKRVWRNGDKIEVELDFRGRVVRDNNYGALMRGPIVFGRDVRFKDGPIDEAGVFVRTKKGVVKQQSAAMKPEGVWMAVTADMVLGPNPGWEGGKAREVYFCDYASAGNTWDMASYYRVWLQKVINVRAGE